MPDENKSNYFKKIFDKLKYVQIRDEMPTALIHLDKAIKKIEGCIIKRYINLENRRQIKQIDQKTADREFKAINRFAKENTY